jgi:hypothetical protein
MHFSRAIVGVQTAGISLKSKLKETVSIRLHKRFLVEFGLAYWGGGIVGHFARQFGFAPCPKQLGIAPDVIVAQLLGQVHAVPLGTGNVFTQRSGTMFRSPLMFP